MKNRFTSAEINRIIFLGYVFCISVLSFYHEFWRDELQAYMLVKSSHSIAGLMSNSRYEGHPSLWFFMLFALKSFAPGLLPMKILHLLISALSGWLLIKFSPFKPFQKILLLAGYFFFYEYTFIVRNYALGLLFILAFCVLFPRRKSPTYFIFLALSVAGMMLSNFYSFFIGFALMMLLIAEHLFYSKGKENTWRLIPGYLLMFAAVILFVLDTLPPADYGYANLWNTKPDFRAIINTIGRVYQVFMPVTTPSQHFWNSVFVSDIYIKAFLGTMIIIGAVFIVAQKSLSRWFMALIFIMLLGFSYVKFNGYLRHNGHLYIAFIAMMWLQPYLPGKTRGRHKLSDIIFNALLLIQVTAMMIAVSCEIAYPFSQAKNAAAYIEKNYPNSIVVAHNDPGVSSVCAYLDFPFFYPKSGQFGTFIVWNARRLEPHVATAFLIGKGDSVAQHGKKKAIYLTSYPIDSSENYGLVLRKSFTPSVEPEESYYLYTKR